MAEKAEDQGRVGDVQVGALADRWPQQVVRALDAAGAGGGLERVLEALGRAGERATRQP